MAKKKVEEVKEEVETKKVKAKKDKKPKTSYEKRKLFFKIAGWIMALAMLFGAIATMIAPLIYK